MHLIPAAGEGRQKLNKRIVAKDAFDAEGLTIAFNSQGDDLILAIRGLEGGGFGAVLEAAGRIKGDSIGGLYRPFGQGMVR